MGLCCPSNENPSSYNQLTPASSTSTLSAEQSKRKLKDALLLLTDRPDGIADISCLALTKIPKGFFELCAVYIKTKLILHDNSITDLESGGNVDDGSRVKSLELQRNLLEKLPLNFGLVFSILIELNLSHNRLKILPTSFASCRSLKCLLLSHNLFAEFPNVVCEVKTLEELDITGNSFTKLPVTFHNLRRLRIFLCDHDKISYPSKTIFDHGITAILKKLCEDDGKEFGEIPVDAVSSHTVAGRTLSAGDISLYMAEENRLRSLAVNSTSDVDILNRYKEEEKRMETVIARYASDDKFQKKEVLRFHAALEEDDRRNLEIVHKVHLQQQQMLMRSLHEREKFETELQKLTQSVEYGNKTLLEALREMELHSQKLLAQLTNLSNERQNHYKYYEEEAKRAEQSWRNLLPELEDSQRKMVLSSMKAQLEESQQFDETYKEWMDATKAQNENMINMHRNEQRMVPSMLAQKQAEQENIINSLLQDENVQREMYRMLQIKTDAIHTRILSDLVLLENELATLSLLEQKQTEERSVLVKKSLEDERLELAKMYKRLTKEKEEREIELKKIMADMEREAEKHAENFWLAQYGRLLEIMPHSLMNKTPEVVQMDLDPSTMKGKPTIPVVTGPQKKSGEEPSSSKVIDKLPQTLHLETTCAICLDRASTEIFLPCGHICCCKQCSENILECPLCRMEIHQKMTLNKSEE